ncbi:hypothetical protein AB0J72_40540 [Dactylosporangium sp. NPDC049742]|uniref:hypothetical protein n=1 Tax=Dactylosporangium sp. NPDC049742 TaxID=3154737 RepID=UPI00344259D5
MGMYLVDVRPGNWEHATQLDRALAERGLGAYPGPRQETADRFEEKLSPPMDGFAELCERHGATDVLEAALFVPVPFDGLITLPVGNAYDDERTVVLSSHRLRDLVAPLVADVRLPSPLPRGPLALVTGIDDPVAFYVAMYRQAAEHSLRHGCPLTYI